MAFIPYNDDGWYNEQVKKWICSKCQKEEEKKEESAWPNQREYQYLSSVRDALRFNMDKIMEWHCNNQQSFWNQVKEFIGIHTYGWHYFTITEGRIDLLSSECIRLIDESRNVYNPARSDHLKMMACYDIMEFARHVGYPHAFNCFERIQE